MATPPRIAAYVDEKKRVELAVIPRGADARLVVSWFENGPHRAIEIVVEYADRAGDWHPSPHRRVTLRPHEIEIVCDTLRTAAEAS